MLDPSDPFADDDKERREVEELARKFESKYVSVELKMFYHTILCDVQWDFCNKSAGCGYI